MRLGFAPATFAKVGHITAPEPRVVGRSGYVPATAALDNSRELTTPCVLSAVLLFVRSVDLLGSPARRNIPSEIACSFGGQSRSRGVTS